MPEITLAESPESPVYKFEKTRFSMVTPEVKTVMDGELAARKQVILCGLETHVCILQTALDLIDDGYKVYVIADAVMSIR